MRDPASMEEILSLLRDFWLRSPSASIAGLIDSAVDPAVSNEIASTPDARLLRKLRAMAYYATRPPGPTDVVSVNHLAALDEARNYDAASSWNWLHSELQRLRDHVAGGGTLRVHEEDGQVVISSVDEFDAWATTRYRGV